VSRPLKYRRAPKIVDAMRVYADELVMSEVARWCGGVMKSEAKASDHTDVAYWIKIPTMAGLVRARPGDYIVKDADGRFSVWKQSDFEDEYERVGLRSP